MPRLPIDEDATTAGSSCRADPRRHAARRHRRRQGRRDYQRRSTARGWRRTLPPSATVARGRTDRTEPASSEATPARGGVSESTPAPAGHRRHPAGLAGACGTLGPCSDAANAQASARSSSCSSAVAPPRHRRRRRRGAQPGSGLAPAGRPPRRPSPASSTATRSRSRWQARAEDVRYIGVDTPETVAPGPAGRVLRQAGEPTSTAAGRGRAGPARLRRRAPRPLRAPARLRLRRARVRQRRARPPRATRGR